MLRTKNRTGPEESNLDSRVSTAMQKYVNGQVGPCTRVNSVGGDSGHEANSDLGAGLNEAGVD